MTGFRFRIGYKISIGYIVLLIFLAASLFIVSGTIKSLQGELDSIVNRDLKIHETTHTLDKYASTMESALYRAIMTGQKADLDLYEGEKAKWKQGYETLKELFNGNAEQTSRLVGVLGAMDRWFAVSDKASATLSYDKDAAKAVQYFADDPGKKAMTGMKEQLSRLRQSEKYVTEKRISSLIDTNDGLRSLLYAMAAVLAVLTIAFSWIVSRNITRNLKRVTSAIADIARSGGDLTRRIQVKATDETWELGQETNKLLASMQTMMRQIQEQAARLSAVSRRIGEGSAGTVEINGQVSEAVRRVAVGAENQVAQTEEISAIMQENLGGLDLVAKGTRQAAELAKTTQAAADSGSRNLDKTQEEVAKIDRAFTNIQQSVTQLSEQSSQILGIVGYMSDISTKTNLLSLNATIEAARAGEYGRGFGVVAAEIRKLADQTAQSAGSIESTLKRMNQDVETIVELIADSSKTVYEGTSAIREAESNIRQIVDNVDDLTSQVIEAASSIGQIAAGSGSVVRSAEEISRVTEETSAFTEQMSAMVQEQTAVLNEFAQTSQQLLEVSDSLKAAVGHFKVDGESAKDPTSPAKH
ncbi:methyl-accepting chemotaxis protein [Cohnella herbarum]|uniref:Methyl-accepting chemotaxis protein n=1 Tax=Cohnella herbarum TaxID=2728023 RepID=A0A7Z2VH70_9BACL|nr:methyl-accepting chemotaxis protein [Cohnella herbarum]QJD83118.1 methyl-accepting chemotaxis protein [Cohnella herbarum]